MDLECSKLVRLDAKGRFVVPVDLRTILVPPEGSRVLTIARHPTEDCLCLFQGIDWQRKRAHFRRHVTSQRADQLMARRFIMQAVSAELDSNWRFTVPPPLRRQAKLELREDCILLGMGAHLELWHTDLLEDTLDNVPPEVAESLGATLSYGDSSEQSEYSESGDDGEWADEPL